jgi:3-oxoacyl-[acyl-carrier-protein] synthase-3
VAFTVDGLGTALGSQKVANHDLAAVLDTSDEWIRTRTGISTRHRAGPEDTTTSLAAAAARVALDEAGVRPTKLDLVVVATATPDTACPATAARVARELGAPVAAFDVNGACCGFVQALLAAASMLVDPSMRTALVIGADRFSTLCDPLDRTTAVLFGDGAGAVVIRRAEPAEPDLDGPDPDAPDRAASPPAPGLLASHVGGDPAGLSTLEVEPDARYLSMDGPGLFKRATRAMVHSSVIALDRAGMHVEDVDLFVPHQANARIIGAAAERLGLPDDRVVRDVTDRANTSAASIPLALHTARAQGRLHDGATVLLSSVGAGLGWASLVLRWGQGPVT